MGFQDPPVFRAPAPFKARWEDQLSCSVLDKLTRRAGPWGLDWSSSEDRGAVGRGVCSGERPWGTGRTAEWDAVRGAPQNHPGKAGTRALCALS